MIAFFKNIFNNKSSHQELRDYSQNYWGVKPKNITWYLQALRHKSLVGTGKYTHSDCNERLELLGDAVLDAVVTEYLFNRLPEASEGELTKIRSRIVSRKTLAGIGMRAELHKYLEAKIGSDDSRDKITGNALEAWLGAIYIDSGYDKVQESILNYLMGEYLDVDAAIENTTDYKSQFIEWAQAQKITFNFQTYAHAENAGFVCDLYIKSEVVASELDRSKKLAEMAAAYSACQTLEIKTNV